MWLHLHFKRMQSHHFEAVCIGPQGPTKSHMTQIMTHFFYVFFCMTQIIIVMILGVSLSFDYEKMSSFLYEQKKNLKTIKICPSHLRYSKWYHFEWSAGSVFCLFLSPSQLLSWMFIYIYSTYILLVLSGSLNPCLSC